MNGSALIGHLERAECAVVTREHFRKARAIAAESTNVVVDKENLKANGIMVKQRADQQQMHRAIVDPEDEEAFPKLQAPKSKKRSARDARALVAVPTEVPQNDNSDALVRQLTPTPSELSMAERLERSQREIDIIRLQTLMINVAMMDDENNRLLVRRRDGTVWEEVNPESTLYNPRVLRNVLGNYSCPHPYCT